MITCRVFNNIRPYGSIVSRVNFSSSFKDTTEPSDKDLKDQLDMKEAKEKYWEYHQKDFGKVYSIKPIKVKCNTGKIYLWCSCGYSKNQPFCDGTHRVQHHQIKMKPIPFECKETKDYWFCNCKQTKHRPFCDGTHRELKVEEVRPTIRH